MRPRVCISAIAALLITINASKANSFEDGVAAIKKGNYQNALEILLPLAKQGHPNAQAEVGSLYSLGRGTTKNENQATKWYLLAAKGGHAGAQVAVAFRYIFGTGPLLQDYALAAKWLQEAANQGDARGQLQLGHHYANGLLAPHIPQNFSEAARWYLKAANQNNIYAQYSLANSYKSGRGVPQSYVRAYMWYNLAAASAAAQNADGLSEVYAEYREKISVYLNADDIAKAQRLAREWKLRREK